MFAKSLPVCVLWIACSLLPGLLAAQSAADETDPAPAQPAAAPTFLAEFTDRGSLRLTLEIDQLELESPYGKLSIPTSEIRRVDVALRLTDAEQKRLDDAIFQLGSSDFSQRNEASAVVLALGAKAYPALLKAAKHADLEVAHRAQDLATKLRGTLAEDQLEPREYDIIETDHSRIAGRLTSSRITVRTSQFGKQPLELSDLRSLVGSDALAAIEPVEVAPDPGNLLSFHGSIGKTLAFKVTGRADGSVYGTGVYTTDSNLATAAVHSGALKAGETGVVRVAMIPSPPAFASSSQNGITSSAWGVYPAAYQIVLPRRR